MQASIIAVGSELLGTTRLDTNSLKITAILERFGVGVRRKSVVGDSRDDIAAQLLSDLRTCELVMITGGLGPTEDDLTKEAVAKALELSVSVDEEIIEKIRARFASRGLVMPASNNKQAMVFNEQQTLANPRGTAPGFHVVVNNRQSVWIFPGVPFELEGMLASDFEPWLREKRGGVSRSRRTLKIAGMSESAVEERLREFYATHSNDPVTILASAGEIQLHLLADGEAGAAALKLDGMQAELEQIFGERLFTVGERSLEDVTGHLLLDHRATVATAESCTGGLLGSRITDVPGSSAWFVGGVVTYSGEAKNSLLSVDPVLMRDHGEVSEEVATSMAMGVRARFSSSYGVAITGIAGPGGGSEIKPVGTVHLAVAHENGVIHRKSFFHGTRAMIKRQATQTALDMLRLAMLRS